MNETIKKQKPVRVISVTSGKGGVGKSFIVTNLGVFLARKGFKVCILDADIGLANVHIMMGLTPQKDISDVLKGEACIKDTVLYGPQGLMVIPGGSGFAEFSNMNDAQKGLLLEAIDDLPGDIDYLLIDTSAGIHSNVTFFNAAASEIIVVVNSEPPSIYDSYAAIKVLHTDHQVNRFALLINCVDTEGKAKQVFQTLSTVAGENLPMVSLSFAGYLPRSSLVPQSIHKRTPLLHLDKQTIFTQQLEKVFQSVIRDKPENTFTGSLQFFFRRMLAENYGQ